MERTLLIHPEMPEIDREHGFSNINGPSLVRVPDWVEKSVREILSLLRTSPRCLYPIGLC